MVEDVVRDIVRRGHEEWGSVEVSRPVHPIRLEQARELTGRFGLDRPKELARVLRITEYEAAEILAELSEPERSKRIVIRIKQG